MTKATWLIKITLTDGSEVEVTAKDAATAARMYSAQGRMVDWRHNPNHPDWMAAEAAMKSYTKFLAERKHLNRVR